MAVELGLRRIRMDGSELKMDVLQNRAAILRPMGTELWVEVKKTDLVRQVQAHGQDLVVEIEFSGPDDSPEAHIEMWVPGLYR